MRVEDNQNLAREALPQTALHPMEGKGIRPQCPAQLQDRHGAGGAKEWELQGEQAAAATGQITLLLACSVQMPDTTALQLTGFCL